MGYCIWCESLGIGTQNSGFKAPNQTLGTSDSILFRGPSLATKPSPASEFETGFQPIQCRGWDVSVTDPVSVSPSSTFEVVDDRALDSIDVKRAQASSPPPRHLSWATLRSTRPTPSPSHLAKIFITGFFFGHLPIPPEEYWLSTLARSSAFGLPLQPTLLTRALRRTEMDPNEHKTFVRSGTSTS